MPSAGGAVNDGNVERQCLRPCAEQSGHIVEVVLACLNQVVGDDAPRFAETRVVGHGEVIGPALFLKRLRRGGRWRVAPGGIEREMDVVPDPRSRAWRGLPVGTRALRRGATVLPTCDAARSQLFGHCLSPSGPGVQLSFLLLRRR